MCGINKFDAFLRLVALVIERKKKVSNKLRSRDPPVYYLQVRVRSRKNLAPSPGVGAGCEFCGAAADAVLWARFLPLRSCPVKLSYWGDEPIS